MKMPDASGAVPLQLLQQTKRLEGKQVYMWK